MNTLLPPHGEEDHQLVSGFLGEVFHCLGFHSRYDCCNGGNYDDIVFVRVFVFVFVIMFDLSTEDVAARRG